jgi:glycosyltransferase involved in cell wall biosynthesis
MGVISSICSQRSDQWKIHVVADGPYEGYQKVKDYFNGNDKIKFSELNGPHRDWGHTPRNYGLEHATEEWVVMTGDDNYYTPVFVDHFLGCVTPTTNFVFCDMIHNWTNYQYVHLQSKPRLGSIDIGNFMTRRINSQQMRIDTTLEQADGLFVEEYLRRFPTGDVIHIGKPLYVHN